MPILFGVMVALSVILVVCRFSFDPQLRAIRQRLKAEMEGSDNAREPLAKLLEPLVRLNARTGLYRPKAIIGETIAAGKITLTAAELFALKELTLLAAILLYLSLQGFQLPKVDPLWLMISMVVGFFLPDLWLKQRQAARHKTISRDLPEIVDLLALCVDSGAEFMNAVQRVVREYRPCPMQEELAVVIQEIRIGKRRREAFRSMAHRVRMPDVNAFARAIVHADRMGTGMAQALRIMSEDTRLRRYHAAERFAQQAPLKMLIPLVLIMMTALIMVAGPVLLEFTRGSLFPKF
jgi:tight adherence protein C